MEDEAKLDKILAGHNAEVKPRVKDVQTTRQVLAIQNVRLLHPAALIIGNLGHRRTVGTSAILKCGVHLGAECLGDCMSASTEAEVPHGLCRPSMTCTRMMTSSRTLGSLTF